MIDVSFAFKRLDCGGGLTWVLSIAPYLQEQGLKVLVQGPEILPTALARIQAAGLEFKETPITGAKVVIDSSGGITERKGGALISVRHSRTKWYTGWAAATKAADEVVAVSIPVAWNTKKTIGREPLIITNGVDVERLDRVGQDLREVYGHDFLLGFVGRDSGLKNPKAVADAAVRLKRHAILAGQDIASNARLRNSWTSRLNYTLTPGDVYRAADVLCVPSHHEAFPYSVIEALCMGKRVVIAPRVICEEFADMVYRLPPNRQFVNGQRLAAGVQAVLKQPAPDMQVARDRFGLPRFYQQWMDLLGKYL
jgi:glycosyltransferase involved in cell wall biosynthesis